MYLLRDDGDYHYAIEIPEGAKYPSGPKYQTTDEIEGHALEARIVVEFEESDEIETDDKGKQRRKVKPVFLMTMGPERKLEMQQERQREKNREEDRKRKIDQ